MQGRKIAVVGAAGGIGSQTVSALLAKGIHTITAISRAESKATFPRGVNVRRGAYDNEDFLVSALTGQDVVVIQVGIMVLDSQIPIIKAAAKARVPYILPCEFASDNKHEKLNQEINLMTRKDKYRELIDQLGVSRWVGIVNGPWFDWSFRMKYWGTPFNYWGINVADRKAKIFDDGLVKCNVSTMAKTGQAVAALLSLPEPELSKFTSEFVYVSSFHINQQDILSSVFKATGTAEQDWTIESESAADVAEACKDAVRAGNGMKNVDLLFATIFRDGFGGDFESKVTKLDLEQENLDCVVKKLVDEEITK